MRFWSVRLALGAFALLGWTGLAHAQANQYELNVHAGGLRYDLGVDDDAFENTDTDVMLGARFLLTPGGTWGFGGNFDWVNVDRFGTGFGDDIDVDMYLYSGELNYTFASQGQGKFFVLGGLGGRTIKVEDESESRLAMPLGGGFKWLNRAHVPSWAIRGEVRDHVVFGDENEGEDDFDQNFEFSGGVSFFF